MTAEQVPAAHVDITSEQDARDWLRATPFGTDEAFERLDRLVGLLREENKAQNLVSAASLDLVWQRHILDSAQLLNHVPRETFTAATAPWIDLGTGAGFPGLVIATLRPRGQMVMVESRNRRVDWLHRAIEALDLPNAHVEGQRLELVETRTASVISARAFAPLEKLLTLSARFSTRDTLWLLPKGRSAGDELAALKHAVAKGFHVEQSLTDAEAGIIVGRLNRASLLKGG